MQSNEFTTSLVNLLIDDHICSRAWGILQKTIVGEKWDEFRNITIFHVMANLVHEVTLSKNDAAEFTLHSHIVSLSYFAPCHTSPLHTALSKPITFVPQNSRNCIFIADHWGTPHWKS